MPLSEELMTDAAAHQQPTVESEEDGSPTPENRGASEGHQASATGKNPSATDTQTAKQRAMKPTRYRPAHVSDDDEPDDGDRASSGGRSGAGDESEPERAVNLPFRGREMGEALARPSKRDSERGAPRERRPGRVEEATRARSVPSEIDSDADAEYPTAQAAFGTRRRTPPTDDRRPSTQRRARRDAFEISGNDANDAPITANDPGERPSVKWREPTHVRYYREQSSPVPSPSPPPPPLPRYARAPRSRVVTIHRGDARGRYCSYVPPTGEDPDSEQSYELSYSCLLRRKDPTAPSMNWIGGLGRPGHMGHPWSSRYATLREGVDTELLVINAAESLTDEKNKTVVTMYCQNDVIGKTATAPSTQMHWLHVRYTTDIVKHLRSLVTTCPYVRTEHQTLAINLLDKVCPEDPESTPIRQTWRGVTGAVRRVDAQYRDGRPASDSVIFSSTPYVALRERQRQNGGDAMKSLLSFSYGYNVNEDADRRQVLPQTQEWLGDDIVNIAHFGCLILGPDVMITFGEMSMLPLLENIVIEESDAHPPIMVRIKDECSSEYYTYIKHNTSFVSLITRIASVTSMDLQGFDICLEKPKGTILTAENWTGLLKGFASSLADIHLELLPKPVRYDYITPHSRALGSRYSSRRRDYYESDSSDYRTGPVPSRRSRERIMMPEVNDSQPDTPGSHPRRANTWENREWTEPSDTTEAAGSERSTSRAMMPYTRSKNPSQSPRRRDRAVRYEDYYPPSYLRRDRSYASSPPRPYYPRPLVSEDDSDYEQGARSERHNSFEPMAMAKVVNDAVLQERTERNYYLSSSDSSEEQDDEEDPNLATSQTTTTLTAAHARSLLPESLHDVKQKSSVSNEPIDMKAMKRLESSGTPFLMWGVTGGTTTQQEKKGSLTSLHRLLRKIDKSLRGSKLYANGYRCSLNDLIKRHELAHPRYTKQPQDHEVSTNDNHMEKVDLSSLVATGSRSLVDGNSELSASTDVMATVESLISEIFVLSRSIMGLFIPFKTMSLGDVEVVTDRFWGSLDLVFRLFRYTAMARLADRDQSFVVRGPCGNCQHHVETSPKDEKFRAASIACSTCGKRKGLTLEQALALLDSTDPVPHQSLGLHPAEDPRIVMLDGVKPARADDVRLASFMHALVTFKQDLHEIYDRCRSLHQFFAQPDSDSQVDAGMAEDDADSDLPGLPRSLLTSFRSIVALFSVYSQMMRLKVIRGKGQVDRELLGETMSRRWNYNNIMEKILSSLDKAQEDLILNITEDNSTVISLGAVGPESIVAAAMMNVQRGALRLSSNNSTMTSSKGRNWTGNSSKTWAVTNTPSKLEDQTADRGEAADHSANNTSIDVLSLYSSHLAQLELNASMNPQRRVFLAIRALEDELEALHRVSKLQARSLSNLSKVLDPESFRVTDEARRSHFLLEKNALEYGERSRTMDGEEIDRMLDRARNLRLKVKEDIEVMDEGHGKAIRVFTLVTLFFLPLTFVSGFFGMNTIDIRDTSAGQWLYWSIAAPLTLIVLTSAYLYAYKDDYLDSKRSKNMVFQSKSERALVTSGYTGRPRSRDFGLSRDQRRIPTFRQQWARNRADTWGTM